MNLYRLEWEDSNSVIGQYNYAVVAANDIEEARLMHPNGRSIWGDDDDWWYEEWTEPSNVYVWRIGSTDLPKCVLCASHNAG